MQRQVSAKVARWAVAAMFAINGFIMGSWAPQIPLLLPRHQISEFALGLLILALGAGAVGAMALSGGLIARHGSRTVVQLFAVLAAPTLALVVLAPSLPLVTLAMMAMGALIGCMDVAMNANAVEVERRLGRAIMSSSHGFWSLGGFLGGGFGGLLIDRIGAVPHAAMVSGLALITALIAAPFLGGEPAHAPANAAGPAPQPASRRTAAIYLIGVMALASMVPEGAVLDWAALYLGQELGGDVSSSGLGFALFSAAMALMRFGGDGIRNRFGAVATFRASGLIAALGLLGASLAPGAALAIACFAAAGLGTANMVPITLSAAGNHPGLGPGAGISTVTMMGYSGILVAPSSIGFVAEAIGFRVTYGALALMLLGVALMAHRLQAADHRQVH